MMYALNLHQKGFELHNLMPAAHPIQNNWDSIQTNLRHEIGDTAFQNWIEPLALKDCCDKQVVLSAPSRYVRDWVQAHYANNILRLCAQTTPGITHIDFEVEAKNTMSDLTGNGKNRTDAKKAKPFSKISKPASARSNSKNNSDVPDLVKISANLDPRFTFDNFVIGKPNELAYAAARRVAESDGVSFNPLFLYGGVGLGKTHLMHAIAWSIRKRSPERNVLYLSAEKFMYRFIKAIRYKDTMSFKEQFRSVDVLMIDDVQFISGKDSTQEEFFHTFNALVDQNRQIIVSADKSPSDLKGVEERLRSRLGWGLVADIHPTTYELRLGILESKAADLDVHVPKNVLEFLAHKITSNVRELEGALNRILAHADLVGRAIDMNTTQEVLRDLLRANNRRITMDEIQQKVCDHYNLNLSDMSSKKRTRAIARPRQVAMYLSKQLTEKSLPDIGRAFGGRDHTTVIHACNRIEELMETNGALADDVDLLNRSLANGA